MSNELDKYTIKSVTKCLQILDYASIQQRPISIQDVCNNFHINNNMAFRLLASLQDAGYMVKDPVSGHFVISLKTLDLSSAALQTLEIKKITTPYIELLWTQYPDANINMSVYYHSEIVLLERIYPPTIPRTYFTPGKKLPFHCTAEGKILTCTLSEEELKKLIEKKGLTKYSARTITDSDLLLKELEKVRDEGIGRSRNEFLPGENSTAVPIFGSKNEIIASISISAHTSVMTAEENEKTIPKLRETAAKISELMGYKN